MKNFRNFSTARFTRILAASSLRAQGRPDFFHAFAVEKPQHDGVAVGFIQAGHRRVQQRRDLRPDLGFVFIQDGLHVGLLFAAGAADFAADKSHRRQPRGLIQPAGKDDALAQMPGFPRQNDEDGLGDFLGLMRIAGVAQRDGIDLVDVPRDERGKGVLGIALRRIRRNKAMSSNSCIYI